MSDCSQDDEDDFDAGFQDRPETPSPPLARVHWFIGEPEKYAVPTSTEPRHAHWRACAIHLARYQAGAEMLYQLEWSEN